MRVRVILRWKAAARQVRRFRSDARRLLGLTLAALVVLLINCLVHGQYIGAGVALLFVVVVGQASQEILKRAR